MTDLFETLGSALNPYPSKKIITSDETPKTGDKCLCSNGSIIEVDDDTTDLGLCLLGAKKIINTHND